MSKTSLVVIIAVLVTFSVFQQTLIGGYGAMNDYLLRTLDKVIQGCGGEIHHS